jgi:hypothetical protein
MISITPSLNFDATAGRPGRLHAEGGKKDIGQFGRVEQHEGVKGEVTILSLVAKPGNAV